MTTWAEVINYVRTRYEIMEKSENWLRFRLDMAEHRTHQVTVHYVRDASGWAWVEISSPVGRADEIDLRRLLELAGTSVVGAAAVMDGVALVKHTVPLGNLSVLREFERPLTLVVDRADAVERELAGTDRPRRPAHAGEADPPPGPADAHAPALAGTG